MLRRQGRFDVAATGTGDKLAEFLTRGEDSSSKFGIAVNLGVLFVLEDFVSGECLDRFRMRRSSSFERFDERITDENFSAPAQELVAKKTYRVIAFEQKGTEPTTVDEREEFLHSLDAEFVGARGLVLVAEQMGQNFPVKYRYYQSFGEAGNFVPDLRVHKDKRALGLAPRTQICRDFIAFLGFFKLS